MTTHVLIYTLSNKTFFRLYLLHCSRIVLVNVTVKIDQKSETNIKTNTDINRYLSVCVHYQVYCEKHYKILQNKNIQYQSYLKKFCFSKCCISLVVKHLFIIILNIKNNAPYHFAQSLAFNLDETPTRSSKFQKVKLLCFFAKKFDFEREVEIPIIFHPYFFCQILQVFSVSRIHLRS